MLSIFGRGGLLKLTSPFGLVATGIAIGSMSPTIKKTARSFGVLAIRGALGITNSLTSVGNQVKEEMETLVEEAKRIKRTSSQEVSMHERENDYTTQLNEAQSYELQSFADEDKNKD